MSAISLWNGAQKGFANLQGTLESTTNALSKFKGALGEYDAATNGKLTALTNMLFGELQRAGTLWRNFNDQAVKNVREVGLAINDIAGYQRTMMSDAKAIGNQYGIATGEMLKFQKQFNDLTYKSQLLSKHDLENMSAMSKLIGNQAMGEGIKNFDRLGGSLNTATEHMAKTWGMARRYGLNAEQASNNFAKNLKLAESYTFANGINGITKMTLLSQKLKFDMQSVAKSAESNFGTIDSAIESSAKLQMLGGNLGSMFTNPMDALYESINDMEGFTNRIISGVSQRGKFNKATGVVELSGLDKMFLKEQAKALGMNYEDLYQMATQTTANKQIEGQMTQNFNEEQKAYITSNAKYDTLAKKHYIDYYNPTTQKNEKKYVENLSIDMVSKLQDMAAPEQVMQGDIADIRLMLMNYFHTTAKDLVTQREREAANREKLTLGEAEAIDGVMNMYGDLQNSLADNNSFMGGIFNWITNHGWAALGTGVALTFGKNMIRGLASGGLFRGVRGGTSPGSTSWIRELKKTGRITEQAGSWATLGETGKFQTEAAKTSRMSRLKEGAKSAWSKTKNAAKKAGSKVKSAWGKMGKGGKAALIAGGALLLGSLFAGGGKEEAEPTEEGFEGGPGIEGGQDLLLELQKHTVLLEKIAGGVNAEELHAKKYGSQSGPEGQEYGLLDKTMDTAGMAVLPMMAADSVRNHIIGQQTGHSAKVVARTRSIKAVQSGGKQVANIAGKAGLKMGAKTAGTLVKAGMKAPGIGMIADLGNLAGQSLGLWKEGSFADKALSTVGDAGTGAMIGGMILPGVGHVVGGIIGGTVGIVRNFGKDIAKGVKSVAKKAWSGIKSVGKGIANFFGFGGEKEEEIKKKMELPEFETKKFGETAIDDPKLFEKAALSVISIHDFLISKLGDKNNAAVAEAKSKASGALGILGGPLGMAGSAVGGILGGVGNAIGSVASGAGNLIKNVVTAPFKFIGGLLGIGGDEKKEKEAETELPLQDRAAKAVIDIRDMLRGEGVFGGSLFKRRIPEILSGTNLSTYVKENIKAAPLGGSWFEKATNIASGEGLFGGETGIGSIAPIDINVNGTIKLDLGSGSFFTLDAKKLLENKQFTDKIVELVSDSFQKNVSMGAGANRSNPARRGIGNTDVIAGRRR